MSALADEIRDYAHDLLSIHTVNEYNTQIGEWQKYINRVVDAEKQAVSEHKRVIEAIAAEEKAKAEANARLMALAFSLVTGPLISWVSGAIQYKLVPMLTGTVKEKFVNSIPGSVSLADGSKWITDPSYAIGSFTEESHNKVFAKMMGDIGKKGAEGVFSFFAPSEKHKIPERATGESYKKLLELADQTFSADQFITSLKTTLENAMISEKDKTATAIGGLGLAIKRHLNWGKLALEKMYKVNPGAKKLSGTQLKWAAYKYTEKLVDETREVWAETWFYYGNNPPNTSTYEMSRKIEREIWSLWILDQKFTISGYRYDSYKGKTSEDIYLEEAQIEPAKGRDKLPFGATLLKQLAELHIISPRSNDEKARKIINKQNMPDENFKPISSIYGDVDYQDELTAVETWAKSHPVKMLAGINDSETRMLTSIINYAK